MNLRLDLQNEKKSSGEIEAVNGFSVQTTFRLKTLKNRDMRGYFSMELIQQVLGPTVELGCRPTGSRAYELLGAVIGYRKM